MPASFTDPKTYVRQIPIPVTSHKGIKIQARSHSAYNATIPTRDEVRRENYARRQMQMTHEGFQSAKNRPYRGIGDPFYLEPKKLVSHALGQWDNEDEHSTSDTNEFDEEEDLHNSKQEERPGSKMLALRRTNDSSELNKRLAYGRQMIRTVSLGRSFKGIVREEAENKIRTARKEIDDARELMRTTMRPAKIKSSLSSSSSSSSDETDDDDDHDCVMNGSYEQEGISNEFQKFSQYRLRPFSSVIQNRESLNVQDVKMIPKSKSASCLRSRGQRVQQRPYTPQHSNIAATLNSSADKESVFRQLCAIYWLLEAMNLDPPRITRPITSCWNTKDVNETDSERQKRIGTDKAKRDNKLEAQWKQFSSVHPIRIKRGARLRGNSTRLIRPDALPNFESASVCSFSDTWDQRSQTVPTEDATVQEEMETSNQVDSASKSDITESSRNKCPSPKCRENRVSSPSGLSIQQDSSLSDMSLNSSHMKRGLFARPTKTLEHFNSEAERKELQRLSQHAQIMNMIDHADQESHLYRRPGIRENLRAEANVRPKSSSAVLQYQETLPSNRLKNMTQKMKQQFTEVAKEQNMILRDALSALDRNRLKEIEHRFDAMPTDANVRTALQAIRMKEESTPENKAEAEPEIYQPWFLNLIKSLSNGMKESWLFQKMLDKLSRYGLVEAGKHSTFKFMRILACLREWEICAPDISAAVEFCREKVVEMDIEEYEKWFSDTFPNVSRPQNLSLKSPKKEQIHVVSGLRAVDQQHVKSASAGSRKIIN